MKKFSQIAEELTPQANNTQYNAWEVLDAMKIKYNDSANITKVKEKSEARPIIISYGISADGSIVVWAENYNRPSSWLDYTVTTKIFTDQQKMLKTNKAALKRFMKQGYKIYLSKRIMPETLFLIK